VTGDADINCVLTDTNAFLYFINNDLVLTAAAREVFESAARIQMSSVSIWEIAIKVSIGKLPLPDSFGNFVPYHVEQNDIQIVSPRLEDYKQVASLPFHHKDPFDRLIIAQALIAKLPVVSADKNFDLYGIKRIW